MNTEAVYVPRMHELTVADLLAELSRMGADTDTVTFRTTGGPVMACDDDYDITREHGGVVVVLGPHHEW